MNLLIRIADRAMPLLPHAVLFLGLAVLLSLCRFELAPAMPLPN
jgi:hypothetical protein